MRVGAGFGARRPSYVKHDRAAQRLAGECHRERHSSEFRVGIGARPLIPLSSPSSVRRRRPAAQRSTAVAAQSCIRVQLCVCRHRIFLLRPYPGAAPSACAVDSSIMSKSKSTLGSRIFFRHSFGASFLLFLVSLPFSPRKFHIADYSHSRTNEKIYSYFHLRYIAR